ncbi:MAG: sugar phosphate isomerase/epimerase [Planctomycetota bacterium]|nr:sugar phosphate isomerase/epimerase [Planctomycetota bacterium]
MQNSDMQQRVFTRREICRMAAAGTLFGWGTRALGDGNKRPFSLNYILASSMYGTIRLEEILPQVAKTGAACIDIWPRGHADQREQIEAMGHDRFAELLKKNNVRLGMSTCYNLGPFRLQDEMRFVKKFDGKLLICGSAGPRNPVGAECKRAVKQFVEKMKPHTAAAEELGLTIGIENHANALINTPDSLRYLADLADSPGLGIALAPYHLPQDPKLIAELIEHLGPKLVHFYAWQHGKGCHKKLPKQQELEQMPGRGSMDFGPLLAALKKIGYSRWTEIFMHPVPRGIPILDTTAQVTEEINRARRYLDGLVKRS